MVCHDNIKTSQLHLEDLIKNADFSQYHEDKDVSFCQTNIENTPRELENPFVFPSNLKTDETEVLRPSIKPRNEKNSDQNISKKVGRILQKVKDAKIENECLKKVAQKYLTDFSY